jgi:hypothetical protein
VPGRLIKHRRLMLRLPFVSRLPVLAACGFQLRGTANLPFETIYMPPADHARHRARPEAQHPGRAPHTVVDDRKPPMAVLEFYAGSTRLG